MSPSPALAKFGGRSISVRCDVSLPTECRRAVKRTVDEMGSLDILANSAGVMRRATVLETTEGEWDQVMSVNVKSIFLLNRHAIPIMIQRGRGVITNTASGWGLVGDGTQPHTALQRGRW